MRRLIQGFAAPALLALVVAGVACDEDVSTKPKLDGPVDRTPDTTPKLDTAPGTDAKLDTGGGEVMGSDAGGGTDGGVPDAAMDMAPPADTAVDTTPTTDLPVDQPPPPPDTSPDLAPDLTPDVEPDLAPDTAPAALEINGCTAASYADATGGTDPRTLIWGPANMFDTLNPKKCMKVQVGQTVTWAGDFTSHPLEPLGGTAGTPITAKNSGGVTTHTATFTAAGTYGYHCTAHQASMRGAIFVVP
jgi:plastocyanin